VKSTNDRRAGEETSSIHEAGVRIEAIERHLLYVSVAEEITQADIDHLLELAGRARGFLAVNA
jgi:hypothetical protein